jgi:hypothetical protein
MVCIVPVQAPQNFTADIILRKGGKNLKGALPVSTKKTNMEEDYPFLTGNIAVKISKNQNFTAKMISKMGLKGNPEYHQSIKAGKNMDVHRYSQKALDVLMQKITDNPNYSPYQKVAA